MQCCINGRNYISLLFISAKLFKFEIQKYGQTLCAHKPYFLMPGHKCALRLNDNSVYIIGISELLLLELDTIVMP